MPEICACYRSRGPIARICDTGSRYGRQARPACRCSTVCVPRMRTYEIGASNDREEKGAREEAACPGPVVKMHATDAVAATASLPSSTSSVTASRKPGYAVNLVVVLLVSCWLVHDRMVLGMSEPPELTTVEGEFSSSLLPFLFFFLFTRTRSWVL
mgnify:CR=1 FL=1